jgi:hypothetical protein
MGIVKQSALRLAIAAGVIAAASVITLRPAQAIDTGAAVGIGLGSFALGSVLGSAPRAYPYYYPYGYYYPAPAYYAPPPAYYPSPRSCWDPYYRRYYAC